MMQESFKISADVSFRKVGEEIFVLSRNDSVVFNLNVTGAVVWDGIIAGKTFEEIAGLLCESYNADIDTVRRDIREIIDTMVEKKLVKPL
jgi:hypothetical protein